MASPTSKLVLASTAAISLSSIFVGANAALTYIALPTVLLPPPHSSTPSTTPPQPSTQPGHLARQWQNIFNIGSRAGPALAAPSAALFFYCSRLVPKGPTALSLVSRNLFLAAALCNMLIVPFTFTVMKRTNDELHRRADSFSAGNDDVKAKKDAKVGSVEAMETGALVHWWGKLNVARAGFHVAAVGLGVAAVVG